MKYVNEFILLYTRVYLTYHSPSQATDWNNQNKPIICFNKWNAPSFIIYPPITYWNEANDKRQAKSEPRMEKFQRDEYKNWKLKTEYWQNKPMLGSSKSSPSTENKAKLVQTICIMTPLRWLWSVSQNWRFPGKTQGMWGYWQASFHLPAGGRFLAFLHYFIYLWKIKRRLYSRDMRECKESALTGFELQVVSNNHNFNEP